MSYHPNFFEDLGDTPVRRNCAERLSIIQNHIKLGCLLDIGCSEGFYSFGLHKNCSSILAIDKEQQLIHIAQTIQQNQNQGWNIDFRHMELDDVISGLGYWDTCLYLSIHHHIIAQFGLDGAKGVLLKLSERCDTMFFDMGQKNEHNCNMHRWWQLLPGNDDQEKWLAEYLGQNTIYNNMEIIGSSSVHGIQRLLWKLTK